MSFHGWKSAITYWYFCLQRHDLAAKSKKHPRCFKTLHNFNFLHLRPANVEVFQDIKNYIKEHIDLLLREIYAQLVSIGLDLSIHQKQIQFWWSKLEENKYKHHENAFKSTIEWLNQENYNTRLEETITVHATSKRRMVSFNENHKWPQKEDSSDSDSNDRQNNMVLLTAQLQELHKSMANITDSLTNINNRITTVDNANLF
ncbi:unnamed protein product [Rhizophagus irregularis]|nr:unnamed protein product [Rhizophagus irregularis]